MKMFENMTTEGLEESVDFLGGSGPLETDIYTGIVKLVYVGQAQNSKATSITVHIDLDGREFRDTHWITNRNGENFYADKKDPKKLHKLPGFTNIDDLCLLTTGFPLAEQAVEEKVVALYDFDQKKDVPQNVQVLTACLGKPITAAVVKQIVDKKTKTDDGKYVPSGETRTENTTEKFFHDESRRTVAEIKAGVNEGIFIEKWAEKNRGNTRDRSEGAKGKTGAPGGAGGNAGRPAPQQSNAPKKSLFA